MARCIMLLGSGVSSGADFGEFVTVASIGSRLTLLEERPLYRLPRWGTGGTPSEVENLEVATSKCLGQQPCSCLFASWKTELV